jgi:type II secretory pathway component GspD/PulD (secretin)
MTELANLARNVFDLKQVTASLSNGYMLLRGDEPTLKLVNATYADMLDAGSDIMFDLNLYELDKTHVNNIGATLPTSASVFSVQQEAQNIVNANQSALNTLLASGQFNQYLTNNSSLNTVLEALALIEYGGVSDANLTNLIALVGALNGVPLAGITVSGTSTFNLSLNSTDTRLLDSVKLRSSNGQAASFRAGSRYPVVTGTYSSGVSSALASAVSGLNINGTSVSSLLNKYLGTSTSIPQFQFEDLGITLKITPTVLHGNEVQLKLDLKLEALAGTSLNSIPVLNNRAMTSTITIPTGDTAMLAAYVSSNEIGSIAGLPGLSELPGFQGTDKDVEHDSSELLITITPHVVRQNAMRIASRRLAVEHTGPAAQ